MLIGIYVLLFIKNIVTGSLISYQSVFLNVLATMIYLDNSYPNEYVHFAAHLSLIGLFVTSFLDVYNIVFFFGFLKTIIILNLLLIVGIPLLNDNLRRIVYDYISSYPFGKIVLLLVQKYVSLFIIFYEKMVYLLSLLWKSFVELDKKYGHNKYSEHSKMEIMKLKDKLMEGFGHYMKDISMQEINQVLTSVHHAVKDKKQIN